jgi:hypothetical protein
MIEERSRTFCERVEAFQAKEGEGKEKQGQVCRVDVGFAAVTNGMLILFFSAKWLWYSGQWHAQLETPDWRIRHPTLLWDHLRTFAINI